MLAEIPHSGTRKADYNEKKDHVYPVGRGHRHGGCFEQAAIELDRRVRTEELAQIGKPPFQSAFCHEDAEEELVKVILWIDEGKPVAREFRVRIKEEDADGGLHQQPEFS